MIYDNHIIYVSYIMSKKMFYKCKIDIQIVVKCDALKY